MATRNPSDRLSLHRIQVDLASEADQAGVEFRIDDLRSEGGSDFDQFERRLRNAAVAAEVDRLVTSTPLSRDGAAERLQAFRELTLPTRRPNPLDYLREIPLRNPYALRDACNPANLRASPLPHVYYDQDGEEHEVPPPKQVVETYHPARTVDGIQYRVTVYDDGSKTKEVVGGNAPVVVPRSKWRAR